MSFAQNQPAAGSSGPNGGVRHDSDAFPPPRGRGSKPLGRIRDILLGDSVRQLELQLNALHSHLSSEVDNVRTSLQKPLEQLRQELSDRVTRCEESLDTLRNQQKQLSQNVESELSRLNRAWQQPVADLRKQVMERLETAEQRILESKAQFETLESQQQAASNQARETREETKALTQGQSELKEAQGEVKEKLQALTTGQEEATDALLAEMDALAADLRGAMKEVQDEASQRGQAVEAEFQRNLDQLRDSTETAVTRLAETKADRATLASMLRELASKVEDAPAENHSRSKAKDGQ